MSAGAPRFQAAMSDRARFGVMLHYSGVRLDVRDDLLKSTPLGWACHWGRIKMVETLIVGSAPAGRTGCGTLGFAKGMGRDRWGNVRFEGRYRPVFRKPYNIGERVCL